MKPHRWGPLIAIAAVLLLAGGSAWIYYRPPLWQDGEYWVKREAGTNCFFIARAGDATVTNGAERLAARVVLVRRSGARLGRYGLTKMGRAVVPQFYGTNTLARRLNERLLTGGRVLVSFFTRFEWSELWQESAGNQYEAEESVEFVLVTERAVSLVWSAWDYTGGAHGNTEIYGRSFYEVGETVGELALEACFDQCTNWQPRLSALVLADLRRQTASGVTDGMVTNLPATELQSFTAAPDGLRFYFPPYEVGTYAEGEFIVRVPWEALGDCVRTNGPVQLFRGGNVP